ncbi:glutathione transferase GST 23-like [Typha latifolia]|uniref:glutathione transferase GST 23-like n=1 Tax=Typha latifolia TaxID=4733 RepID=UPI003C2E7DD3
MEQSSSLKLLGSWASSYTHRVQLALKLKGLEFEYVEEDLTMKSPSLLLHNPIYKKVPVLLHRDRPIVESVIIIQYVDDTWPDHPIMPSDPYDRALARFWCHFADDKLGPAVGAVFGSSGEDQIAAVGQVHENLGLIESELREGAFKGKRFFGGDNVGFLDIVLGCGSYWLAVFEEVTEVKLVDPEAFPLFHAWLRDFEEQKEVKETIPAIDKLLEYARGIRQMILLSHTATSTASNATTDAATIATAKVDVVVDGSG